MFTKDKHIEEPNYAFVYDQGTRATARNHRYYVGLYFKDGSSLYLEDVHTTTVAGAMAYALRRYKDCERYISSVVGRLCD